MNGKKAKLPIGVENFEEIRTRGFYYVDKTGLIKELLEKGGKVNLFTRPRRFGKSLNMSMLKYFFRHGCESGLFEGLAISREKSHCEEYMGKCPVISITLKGVDAGNYIAARSMLCFVIGNEAMNFSFLAESSRLTEGEVRQYGQLVNVDASGQQGFIMADGILENSLLTLCRLLHKHYGRKVVLLIDEYDVPLDKAQQAGYYEDMASLLRNLFGQALKSNDSLELAVLTGCLKVAKESIFTGLNNMYGLSITSVLFEEYFGFSDGEVRELLNYYGIDAKYETVKTWYDGHRFGNRDVYCPWDVINYCAELRADPDAPPRAFWANTSGNDILRSFLRLAKPGMRRELERLVNGEGLVKKINQELTYRELYENVENIWSVLFSTGYLTHRGRVDVDAYQLAVPNLEIRQIFVEHILEWFQEEAGKDAPRLDAFCDAFRNGDAEGVEKYFNGYLAKTISVRDAGAPKGRKENFYHGILLGLLEHREEWYVRSNAEAGCGFSDILVEIRDAGVGIVIEVKYPDGGDLERGSEEALAQIERMGYEEGLRQDGLETILKYGIACNRKSCRVKKGV